GEFNTDFHLMVDFIAASPLRYALTVKPTIFVSHIRQFWSTARIETTEDGTNILATVDGIQRTISESSLMRNLKLRDEDGIVSIPDTELFKNLTLMGILPLFDTILVHQGNGSGTPTEPHHTITPEADISHPTTSSILLPSLSTAPIPPVSQTNTTPIRQYSRRARIAQSSALLTVADEPASHEEEILRLKERVQVLEDRDNVTAKHYRDDAPIKGRSINEGEAAAERISNDSEEVARVLTSMDAATVLARGIDVPTGSGSIPTAGPPATVMSTGSEVGPTASLIITSYSRRKGKEVMVESDTPKKQRLQEQIDAQSQQRRPMTKKQKREYYMAMISDLVKYQENYSKVYQFQSQQRRPMTKKQKREYYMAMIRNNLRWKVKDFKGLSFEEIEAKFAKVWKQVEDFIPMGSKEEAKRLKRKGLNLEQEHVKKQKSSEEAPEMEKYTKEITKEKMKEMM
nr:hypothetical protein [Tanacetum cinerariifolium]